MLLIVSLQVNIAARKKVADQPSKFSPIDGKMIDAAKSMLAIMIVDACIHVRTMPVHSSKNLIFL